MTAGWVLIIWINLGGQAAMATTAEFTTQQYCQTARDKILSSAGWLANYHAECFKQ